MTDIPLSIKIAHSLGLVKVKAKPKIDHLVHDQKTVYSKGTMPKGFFYDLMDKKLEHIDSSISNHLKKETKSISIKLSHLLIFIPVFLMVLIPIVALMPNQNNSMTSAPAQSVDVKPIDEKYTDSQIIAKYPLLSDLDKALNSGELNIDQVSDNMKGMIKQQKLGPYHVSNP